MVLFRKLDLPTDITKGWQAGALGGSSTMTLSMSFSFCLRGSSYIMADDSSHLTG